MTAPARTAVAIREESTAVAVVRPTLGLVRPIASPAEVLKVQEETRAMVTETLKEGRDFGVIPGTDKPSMLKPGAERTAIAFGCYFGEPEIIEREVDHDRTVQWTKRKKVWNNAFDGDRSFEWKDESGTSYGLYRYVVRVSVIHQATGLVIGSAIGSCSTMESKYVDRPRDSENTALKMAHKRALVGATLLAFGLSDQFTQDTEDMPREQLVGENAPKLEPMDPACPKCAGKMYDNRLSKRSPKQPDFKCKNKNCDGVIWPPKQPAKPTQASQPAPSSAPVEDAEYSIEEPESAVIRNADWALSFAFPLMRGSPLHGKPLRELSTKDLTDVKDRIVKTRSEKADPTWNDETFTAISLVLAFREAPATESREPVAARASASGSSEDGLPF